MGPVFFEIHSDNLHEAPGSREDTLGVFAFIGNSGALDILDAGCGTGAASLALLDALPEARVLAVDVHAPFITAARDRMAQAEDTDRFEARVADMAAPDPDRRFDLVWAEGSAYALGVPHALDAWRGLLAPGGQIVFSELVWRTGAPPPGARTCFEQDYPAMTDVPGTEARVAAAGLRVIATRPVSEAGWRSYYEPLEARIEAAARRHGPGHPAVREARREIAVWREDGEAFGYVFFVVAP